MGDVGGGRLLPLAKLLEGRLCCADAVPVIKEGHEGLQEGVPVGECRAVPHQQRGSPMERFAKEQADD